jgi:hypothetical protein
MRCGQLQDWLRELTAYPSPAKISGYLRGELDAIEPGAGEAADSVPRRHLRRCERCRERVRRALKYWSLLALFCRDVKPGPALERRVGDRILADALAGAAAAGTAGGPPPARKRAAVEAAHAASREEEALYHATGGAIPVVGWLLAIAGPSRGADFTLAPGENVIGSGDGCDLVIEDASVAPRHASIVCAVSAAGVSYWLLDHGAPGGTFVNGGDERVSWTRLADNDALRLGEVRLKFKALVGVPADQ